jgi:hypothetical protein
MAQKMKKILTFALCAVAAAACTQPQQKVHAASLQNQLVCARQARADYAQYPTQYNVITAYFDHYDAASNKCFVEIVTTDFAATDTRGGPLVTHDVMDAFEQTEYGLMASIQKPAFNTIQLCQIANYNPVCSSEEEWKQLMERRVGTGWLQ